ncbi:FIG00554620: hypothetical protein [Cronobacter universalis NCTC 9529]|nr:FIG00554620: hypothetical protein [Cronobacter universalis NCTC 9529]
MRRLRFRGLTVIRRRHQRGRRHVVENAVFIERRVIFEQAVRVDSFIAEQRLVAAALEVRQRIFRVAIRLFRGVERVKRLRFRRFRARALALPLTDAVGDRELLHQAVPDFGRHCRWRVVLRVGFRRLLRFRRLRRLRLLRRDVRFRRGHRDNRLRVQRQIAHLNAVIVNAQHIAVLQLNLTAALQRNIVQHHAGDVAAVSDAALAVRGDMDNRLQAGNRSFVIRQYQIVIRTTANRAARRVEVTAALRRLVAGLVGSNRESHSVFLPGVISAQTSRVLSDARRLRAKEQSRACALPVTACR